MTLQSGEVVDGKYRIVRAIGEGGMGAVYEGENTRIKRRVAIKVLHAAVAGNQDAVQRFEREAQAAGRIGSAHIVEVLDLGSLYSGERYMVMEYLDGEDITARIKRLGRLSPEQSAPLLIQALEGLAAAHDASIIHRDLKPDNIYILKQNAGQTDFVKLLDFGVSKFSALDAEMSMTRTGAVVGTPYYMSPEQAKGGLVDARSDLYSIGVVAYQMLTGRVPFNAGSFNELLFKIVLEQPEPLDQVVPGIDLHFKGLVERAMTREPEGRFQNAREFKAALVEWAERAESSDGPGTQELPSPFQQAKHSKPAASGLAPKVPNASAAPAGSSKLVADSPFLAPSRPGFPPTAPRSRRRIWLKFSIAMVGGALLGAVGFAAHLFVQGRQPTQGTTTPEPQLGSAVPPSTPSVPSDPVLSTALDTPAPTASAATMEVKDAPAGSSGVASRQTFRPQPFEVTGTSKPVGVVSRPTAPVVPVSKPVEPPPPPVATAKPFNTDL